MSDRVVMKKKLAQALMESGMDHYDGGGLIGGLTDFLGVSNKYQAQAPELQRQNFVPRIGELQQNQKEVLAQQQALAQALLAQSQGGGPNPALAQLNQATGQNVANQAALMASARGASANPALIARLAAQQGAGIQQNAAGQAATMQAQQQLAAQAALANMQNQMAQQALQGESIQQGGVAAQNTAVTTGQLGAQNINAQSSAQNAQQRSGLLGGLLGGAAAAMSGGMFAHGGEVPKMAMGGTMGIENYQAPTQYALPQWVDPMSDRGNQSMNQGLMALGSALKKKPNQGTKVGGDVGADLGASIFADAMAPQAPMMAAPMSMPGGMTGIGSVGAMYAMGGDVVDATSGGKVPGQAVVAGDSEKNDIQPALLSPGEVVIPRSIVQHPDAPDKAAEFVAHLKKNNAKGYGKVIESRKTLKDRVEHLEKLCMGGKVK